MHEFNAKNAIVKYLANEATTIEKEHLLLWIQSKKNQKVFKEFVKAQQLMEVAYTSVNYEAAFDDFLIQIHRNKKGKRTKDFVPYLKYAAIVVGISVALLFLFKMDTKQNSIETLRNEVSLKIVNGNDEVFNLARNTSVKTKNGSNLATVENGVLKYLSNSKFKKLQNVLTVPYGKTFKVILEDGTSIQLNSGSTLTYPTYFKEDEPRIVVLEGEAYFDVAQSGSSAFIVKTNSSNIRVYGTAFNVSSYKDEILTEIVLIEGSVGVKSASAVDKQQDYILITPSQKASISNQSNDWEISNVNVDKYIAWKDGNLFFENDKFENIKKVLERHYDVTIINDFSELNKFRYNGNFHNDSIEKILNTISMHTKFSFHRIGDTISIINPENTINKNEVN